MDLVLFLLGIFLALLGIVGSFLPVLPGPITSWFGLLVLHLTTWVPMNTKFLTITFVAAIVIFVLDYIIPLLGTKKFGGTKSGMFGSGIGLVLGILFMGPLGIIIGPFIGAFSGELMHDFQNKKVALKAAIGSLIGFLTGIFLKFFLAALYLFFFVQKSYTHVF